MIRLTAFVPLPLLLMPMHGIARDLPPVEARPSPQAQGVGIRSGQQDPRAARFSVTSWRNGARPSVWLRQIDGENRLRIKNDQSDSSLLITTGSVRSAIGWPPLWSLRKTARLTCRASWTAMRKWTRISLPGSIEEGQMRTADELGATPDPTPAPRRLRVPLA